MERAAIVGLMPDECGTASDLNKQLVKMLRIVNQLIDQAEERDANPLKYVRDVFHPDITIADL